MKLSTKRWMSLAILILFMLMLSLLIRLSITWNNHSWWLQKLTNGKSPVMRVIAIKQLASLINTSNEQEIIAALSTTMLSDPHYGVRFEAAFLLRSIGRRANSAIPAFGKALSDPFLPVRIEAVAALLEFGREASPVVTELRQAVLTDPDERIRRLARELVIQIGRDS